MNDLIASLSTIIIVATVIIGLTSFIIWIAPDDVPGAINSYPDEEIKKPRKKHVDLKLKNDGFYVDDNGNRYLKVDDDE